MPVHLLSDFSPEALSIVGKGANRKVWFLRKESEGAPLIDAPGPDRLLKQKGWSVVYSVVAEPGWHEEPGVGADQSIEDRWASEEEIVKACHGFQKSGGLINKMHESLEPYGSLVENAIALADFEIGGQTIRKGSWYVGIEPNTEGWEAIEKGEFTGVSIQGTAMRTLVEKGTPEGSSANERSLGGVEKGFLRKLAEKAGISTEDLDAIEAEALEKSSVTFAERMAQRDFEDELPQAFDVLRDAVWSAFYPYPENENRSPADLIGQSLDEFKAWALELIERVPGEDIAKQISDAGESTEKVPSLESMSWTDEEKGRIEQLETKVSELPAAIAKAIKGEDETPTAEDLANSIGELKPQLEKLAADVKKLGEGGTSQDDEPEGESVTKSSDKPWVGVI